ncbi:MAG TPA: PIG-L family deacetylase [Pseudomonadota bacterium]|nr:PIG-L family deacetylase [Pseudomonadota bacterium]
MHFTSETRILVVAAHPDDEILGCGGTLAKAVALGCRVAVLFLGEGVSARFPVGQYDSREYREQRAQREQEAARALAVLGIPDICFGSRYSCQFDTVPLISMVKEIESHLQRFRPTVLFTHNPAEVNVDHRITYHAVESACRPTQPWVPREIYAFEIVCSGGWTFETSFKPNIFVDIGEYWQQKLRAWDCYASEARPFPFPRSHQGLCALANYRGMSAGVALAEGFALMRQVL